MAGELVVNGIDLGSYVAVDGFEWMPDEVVGVEEERAFGGGLRSSERARKRVARITLVPSTDGEALRGLLLGRGDAWGFNGSLYSARGAPVASQSDTPFNPASGQKYGTGYLSMNGYRLATIEWGALPAGTAWTVMGWRADGPFTPAYRDWIRTSDGRLYLNGSTTTTASGLSVTAAGNLRIDGRDTLESLGTWASATAYALAARISVIGADGTTYIMQATAGGTSAGSAPVWPTTYNNTVIDGGVTWRNDGRGAVLADDVVVLPYAVPAAWVASINTERAARAWTPQPRLRVTGSLVPDAPRTMRGYFNGARVVKLGSGFQQVLDFTLKDDTTNA